MNDSFSLLGPMRSTPYAIGERGPGSVVPLIPFMSGQEAFDSLTGYYPARLLDTQLNPVTNRMYGGPRVTDYPETKKAGLHAIFKLAALKLPRGRAGGGAPPPKVPRSLIPAGEPAARMPGSMIPWTVPEMPTSRAPGSGGGSGPAAAGSRSSRGKSFSLPSEKTLGRVAAGGVGLAGAGALSKLVTDAMEAGGGQLSPPLAKPGKPQAPGEPPPVQEPNQVASFLGSPKVWPWLAGGGVGLAGLLYALHHRKKKKQEEEDARTLPFVMKTAASPNKGLGGAIRRSLLSDPSKLDLKHYLLRQRIPGTPNYPSPLSGGTTPIRGVLGVGKPEGGYGWPSPRTPPKVRIGPSGTPRQVEPPPVFEPTPPPVAGAAPSAASGGLGEGFSGLGPRDFYTPGRTAPRTRAESTPLPPVTGEAPAASGARPFFRIPAKIPMDTRRIEGLPEPRDVLNGNVDPNNPPTSWFPARPSRPGPSDPTWAKGFKLPQSLREARTADLRRANIGRAAAIGGLGAGAAGAGGLLYSINPWNGPLSPRIPSPPSGNVPAPPIPATASSPVEATPATPSTQSPLPEVPELGLPGPQSLGQAASNAEEVATSAEPPAAEPPAASPSWLSQLGTFAKDNPWLTGGAALGAGGLGLAGLYALNRRRKKKQQQEAAMLKQSSDLSAFRQEHPIVAGFLKRCGEANLGELEIRVKIAQACYAFPEVAEAFEKVGAGFGIPDMPKPIPDTPKLPAAAPVQGPAAPPHLQPTHQLPPPVATTPTAQPGDAMRSQLMRQAEGYAKPATQVPRATPQEAAEAEAIAARDASLKSSPADRFIDRPFKKYIGRPLKQLVGLERPNSQWDQVYPETDTDYRATYNVQYGMVPVTAGGGAGSAAGPLAAMARSSPKAVAAGGSALSKGLGYAGAGLGAANATLMTDMMTGSHGAKALGLDPEAKAQKLEAQQQAQMGKTWDATIAKTVDVKDPQFLQRMGQVEGDIEQTIPKQLPNGKPNPQFSAAVKQQKSILAREWANANPQEMAKVETDAKSQVGSKLADPAAKPVIEGAVAKGQNGETDPAVAGANAETLAKTNGWSLEQAGQKVGEMDWGSNLAMWLGLGLGAIGLISALTSEEGGIGSWLMALLGVGTAAGVAAHHGVLGEGAQTFMHDSENAVGLGALHNKATGGAGKDTPPPAAGLLSPEDYVQREVVQQGSQAFGKDPRASRGVWASKYLPSWAGGGSSARQQLEGGLGTEIDKNLKARGIALSPEQRTAAIQKILAQHGVR